MNPVEAARVTAALSHIGGILETLPLDEYLDHLREQRAALPQPWANEAKTPYQEAIRRRLQALIAAGTKGLEIAEEAQTASAFWRQARAIENEEVTPPPAGPGAAILTFPPGARRPAPAEGVCKCPLGECSHRVGLDGPA